MFVTKNHSCIPTHPKINQKPLPLLRTCRSPGMSYLSPNSQLSVQLYNPISEFSILPCVYVYSFSPTKAPAGHIIRSANQFVDQGYNNYAAPPAGQWREPSSQRVLSPSQPPVNASTNGTATRIIPIAIEGGRGGPVSQSPVLLQK